MLASFNVKQVLDPWEDAAGDLERYDTDPWEDAAGDLERYDTPLHAAVLFRDIDSIRLLLCFRVDVDGYQAYDSPCVVVTPLFEAVRTRYTDALVLLLEARADANKFGIDHDVSRMGFGTGHLVEEVPHAYAITSLWYAASRIIEHPLIYSNQHVALLMKFQADPRQPGKFEHRLSDDAESDASDAGEDRFVEARGNGTSPLDIARQACLERSCQQTQALLCLLGRGSDDDGGHARRRRRARQLRAARLSAWPPLRPSVAMPHLPAQPRPHLQNLPQTYLITLGIFDHFFEPIQPTIGRRLSF